VISTSGPAEGNTQGPVINRNVGASGQLERQGGPFRQHGRG